MAAEDLPVVLDGYRSNLENSLRAITELFNPSNPKPEESVLHCMTQLFDDIAKENEQAQRAALDECVRVIAGSSRAMTDQPFLASLAHFGKAFTVIMVKLLRERSNNGTNAPMKAHERGRQPTHSSGAVARSRSMAPSRTASTGTTNVDDFAEAGNMFRTPIGGQPTYGRPPGFEGHNTTQPLSASNFGSSQKPRNGKSFNPDTHSKATDAEPLEGSIDLMDAEEAMEMNDDMPPLTPSLLQQQPRGFSTPTLPGSAPDLVELVTPSLRSAPEHIQDANEQDNGATDAMNTEARTGAEQIMDYGMGEEEEEVNDDDEPENIFEKVTYATSISSRGVDMMDDFVYDFVGKIVEELTSLLRMRHGKTILVRDVEAAVKLVLERGERADTATALGREAANSLDGQHQASTRYQTQFFDGPPTRPPPLSLDDRFGMGNSFEGGSRFMGAPRLPVWPVPPASPLVPGVADPVMSSPAIRMQPETEAERAQREHRFYSASPQEHAKMYEEYRQTLAAATAGLDPNQLQILRILAEQTNGGSFPMAIPPLLSSFPNRGPSHGVPPIGMHYGRPMMPGLQYAQGAVRGGFIHPQAAWPAGLRRGPYNIDRRQTPKERKPKTPKPPKEPKPPRTPRIKKEKNTKPIDSDVPETPAKPLFDLVPDIYAAAGCKRARQDSDASSSEDGNPLPLPTASEGGRPSGRTATQRARDVAKRKLLSPLAQEMKMRKAKQAFPKGTFLIRLADVKHREGKDHVWLVDNHQLLQRFNIDGTIASDGSRMYKKTDRYSGWLCHEPWHYLTIEGDYLISSNESRIHLLYPPDSVLQKCFRDEEQASEQDQAARATDAMNTEARTAAEQIMDDGMGEEEEEEIDVDDEPEDIFEEMTMDEGYALDEDIFEEEGIVEDEVIEEIDDEDADIRPECPTLNEIVSKIEAAVTEPME